MADGSHMVKAFGLQHPQGANAKVMRSAVEDILQKF
jgi:hypothetical protein